MSKSEYAVRFGGIAALQDEKGNLNPITSLDIECGGAVSISDGIVFSTRRITSLTINGVVVVAPKMDEAGNVVKRGKKSVGA